MKMADSNLLFKEFTNLVNKINPGALHLCPYTEVIFNNTPVVMDTFSFILPRGDYKMIFSFINEKNEEFAQLVSLASVVSSELNPLGSKRIVPYFLKNISIKFFNSFIYSAASNLLDDTEKRADRVFIKHETSSL